MKVVDVIVTLEYGIMYQFKLDEPDYHNLSSGFKSRNPYTIVIEHKENGRSITFDVASIISLSTYVYPSLKEYSTHKIACELRSSARYADR